MNHKLRQFSLSIFSFFLLSSPLRLRLSLANFRYSPRALPARGSSLNLFDSRQGEGPNTILFQSSPFSALVLGVEGINRINLAFFAGILGSPRPGKITYWQPVSLARRMVLPSCIESSRSRILSRLAVVFFNARKCRYPFPLQDRGSALYLSRSGSTKCCFFSSMPSLKSPFSSPPF